MLDQEPWLDQYVNGASSKNRDGRPIVVHGELDVVADRLELLAEERPEQIPNTSLPTSADSFIALASGWTVPPASTVTPRGTMNVSITCLASASHFVAQAPNSIRPPLQGAPSGGTPCRVFPNPVNL
jgi:hypothetical protein